MRLHELKPGIYFKVNETLYVVEEKYYDNISDIMCKALESYPKTVYFSFEYLEKQDYKIFDPDDYPEYYI